MVMEERQPGQHWGFGCVFVNIWGYVNKKLCIQNLTGFSGCIQSRQTACIYMQIEGKDVYVWSEF